MQYVKRGRVAAVLLAIGAALPAHAAEAIPGASVESLLALARQRNPEYAAMRHEADAAGERIEPAGAWPDPKLRIELQDITMAGEQSPSLLPNRVGSTRYQLMQELPWFGKRGLKREVAALEAEAAKGRALAVWAEVASRIKSVYAQFFSVCENLRLTGEILDLTSRLEQIAQARYASGLAQQQDVIRAQIEQTRLRNELIALNGERRITGARLNLAAARPATAPLAEPQSLRPLPVRLEFADLQQRVRDRNPLLSAEAARLKSAEKSRALTYKNRYPDFAIGIAPIQSRSAIREWELMVELNIPLQQDSRRAQEREAEAMVAAASSRKEAAINQALSDLSQAIAGVDAARLSQESSGTSLLPQAELSYKAALVSYENGKLDFATLLDAQRQIRQARQDRIKAQAEGQIRLAEIERLLGEDL